MGFLVWSAKPGSVMLVADCLKGLPLWPAQAWFTAMASLLEMMGQISSITASLFTSCERISGDDTMHQAPKCERASLKLKPGSPGPPGPCLPPTCSTSGCAQQPGRDRPARAHATVVSRVLTVLPYWARVPPLVRKEFQGHHVAVGAVRPMRPAWQFSIITGLPVLLRRLAQRFRSCIEPHLSTFRESNSKATSASTSLLYTAVVASFPSGHMQLFAYQPAVNPRRCAR
mmetsp:Transcript_24233/g.64694  ORF Transcript_24233/g.64694 Transcript_24233/m.64694 type:complete len:229 (+) Transcript_24233:281-967(+)